MNLCIHDDFTVVTEACSTHLIEGLSQYNFGPVPMQMDPTSFRCVFDDPTSVCAKEYVVNVDDGRLPWVALKIDAIDSSKKICRTIYRTFGLTASVFYDCVILDDSAMVTGWVAINNETAVDFDDVSISFVGGTEHYGRRIYSLDRNITVPSHSEKYVDMCTTMTASIRERFVAPANSGEVFKDIYIRNSQDDGIGFDLPEGPIRIFECKDGDVFLVDVGHLPANSNMDEITLGSNPTSDIWMTGEWDNDAGVAVIDVHNSLPHGVLVEVEEDESIDDIIDASHSFETREGKGFFPVEVDAQSVERLEYRISGPALLKGRPPDHGMETSPALRVSPISSDVPVD